MYLGILIIIVYIYIYINLLEKATYKIEKMVQRIP